MSLTLVSKLSLGGDVFGAEEAIRAGLVQILGGEDGLGEEIPAGSEDLEIDVAIDASALLALLLGCTGADLTVKTNSAETPDHTFSLTAGAFGGWSANGPWANPLNVDGVPTDVTKLFVTNASETTAAKLFLVAAVDPTP